mgnify:CR=1 FL=1
MESLLIADYRSKFQFVKKSEQAGTGYFEKVRSDNRVEQTPQQAIGHVHYILQRNMDFDVLSPACIMKEESGLLKAN